MGAADRYFHTLLKPVSYRACELCDHAKESGGSRCRHPAMANEQDLAVSTLRDRGGACGPEAKYLEFPGLKA